MADRGGPSHNNAAKWGQDHRGRPIVPPIFRRHLTMNDPAAWRHLPISAICVSKLLTEDQVTPVLGRLDLTIQEAAAVGGCPEILNQTPHPPLRKDLVVYDTSNVRYAMVLKSFHNLTFDGQPREETEYCINDPDWDRFIDTNDIRAGDCLKIYKKTDLRFHPDPYFVFEMVLYRGNKLMFPLP